jgi:tetratricopeptide (TPR) repeat protein
MDALCERVGRVLGSEVAGVARFSRPLKDVTANGPIPTGRETRATRKTVRIVLVSAAVVLLAGALALINRNAEPGTKPAAGGAAATLAPIDEFPRDPQLRQVLQLLFGLESTVGDFALAESLVKAVRAERPNDPEAIVVSADLNNWYVARYFDQSDERLAAARRDSEWAVQLAPDHPAALAVLGHCLTLRNSDPERARRLLERAVALAPNVPRYHRQLAKALFGLDRDASIALYQEGARRFPADVLSLYDLGLALRNTGRIGEAEVVLDRTLALAPIANAIMWKARILLWRHGDVAGATAMMDRVPERTRQESRVLATGFLIAAMGGEVAPALRALRATPLTMFEDLGRPPKALLLGELFEFLGEPGPARLQYEGAFTVIQQQIARDPTDPEYRLAEAWVRLKLGQPDEARRIATSLRAFLPRPYRTGFNRDWWYTLIPLHLLLGDRAQAVEMISESAVDLEERRLLRNAFARDRRLGAWRDDAEIRALIAEPASPPAAANAGRLEGGAGL